jgi:hypothetical protein
MFTNKILQCLPFLSFVLTNVNCNSAQNHVNKLSGNWIVDVENTIQNASIIALEDSTLIDSFRKAKIHLSLDKKGNYEYVEYFDSIKKWHITGKYELSTGWTGFGQPSAKVLKKLEGNPPNQIHFYNFKNNKDGWTFVMLNVTRSGFELADPLWNLTLKLKRNY